MVEKALVGVVILNYQSCNETVVLYKSLDQQANAKFLKKIVVDNYSTDHEIEQLKLQIPNEDLILNPINNGYAGGNNIGIKRALEINCDYIWVLNPDIEITEANTLMLLLQSFNNESELVAVGPRICDKKNVNTIYSDGGIVYPNKGYTVEHINYKKLITETTPTINYDVSYVNGSCFLIKSESIRNIGLLNESFFMYFEETDWCLRAVEAGYKIATNSFSVVYHESSKKGTNFYFYLTRNRIWLAKIHKKYLRSTIMLTFKQLVQKFKVFIYTKGKSKVYLLIHLKAMFYGITGAPDEIRNH